VYQLPWSRGVPFRVSVRVSPCHWVTWASANLILLHLNKLMVGCIAPYISGCVAASSVLSEHNELNGNLVVVHFSTWRLCLCIRLSLVVKGKRLRVKSELVPVLQLSTTPRRRTAGVKVQFHAFLTSALDGGEWSASLPGRFTPRERASGSHWIGAWLGPRASLDAVVKRKITSPCGESNPR
jgi:hypothetical protein